MTMGSTASLKRLSLQGVRDMTFLFRLRTDEGVPVVPSSAGSMSAPPR